MSAPWTFGQSLLGAVQSAEQRKLQQAQLSENIRANKASEGLQRDKFDEEVKMNKMKILSPEQANELLAQKLGQDPNIATPSVSLHDTEWVSDQPNFTDLKDAIFGNEGGDYKSQAKGNGTASGKYQVIDSTWNNFAGYKRASDAPPDTQEAWMNKNLSDAMEKYNGNTDKAILQHYLGDKGVEELYKNPKKWDEVPAGGNKLTPRQYLDRANQRMVEKMTGRPSLPESVSSAAPADKTKVGNQFFNGPVSVELFNAVATQYDQLAQDPWMDKTELAKALKSSGFTLNVDAIPDNGSGKVKPSWVMGFLSKAKEFAATDAQKSYYEKMEKVADQKLKEITGLETISKANTDASKALLGLEGFHTPSMLEMDKLTPIKASAMDWVGRTTLGVATGGLSELAMPKITTDKQKKALQDNLHQVSKTFGYAEDLFKLANETVKKGGTAPESVMLQIQSAMNDLSKVFQGYVDPTTGDSFSADDYFPQSIQQRAKTLFLQLSNAMSARNAGLEYIQQQAYSKKSGSNQADVEKAAALQALKESGN